MAKEVILKDEDGNQMLPKTKAEFVVTADGSDVETKLEQVVEMDSEMSSTSTNGIQNKVVKAYVDAETSARKSADATLTANLATEVSAREAAVNDLNEAIASGVGTTSAVIQPTMTSSSTSTTNGVSAKGIADFVAEQKAMLQTEIGTLSELETTEKSNLVGAINEIKTQGGGASEARIKALEDEIFVEKFIPEGEDIPMTKNGTISNAYISSNGNLTIIASGGFTTYYYAVSQGDAIKVDVTNCGMNGNYSAFALFSEIPSSQGQSSVYHVPYTQGVNEWVVTQDGYICVGANSTKIDSAIVYKASGGTTVKYSIIGDKTKLPKETIADSFSGSYWKGKKVTFMGDSITADGFYHKKWAQMTGATVVNLGIAGTHIARNTASSTTAFECRYMDIPSDSDMVVIFGGTNDFGHPATCQFGTFGDVADNTISFYAGLHHLFSNLYTNFRGKPVVIMTPIHHGYEVDTHEYDADLYGNLTEIANPTSGKTFREYVNAIKEVATYYSFPILDAYAESGLNPMLENSSTRYYFRDGLHPTEAGGERHAKWMYPLLEKIYEQFYL